MKRPLCLECAQCVVMLHGDRNQSPKGKIGLANTIVTNFCDRSFRIILDPPSGPMVIMYRQAPGTT